MNWAAAIPQNKNHPIKTYEVDLKFKCDLQKHLEKRAFREVSREEPASQISQLEMYKDKVTLQLLRNKLNYKVVDTQT